MASGGKWPLELEIAGSLIRSIRFAPEDAGACALVAGRPDKNVGDRVEVLTSDLQGRRRVETPDWVLDALLLRDSQTVVVSCADHLYTLEGTGDILSSTAFGSHSARELSMDAAGNRIAGAFPGRSRPLWVAEVGSMSARSLSPPAEDRFTPMFPNVASAADGSRVALGFGFEALYVWDLESGRMHRAPHPDAIEATPHPSVSDPTRLRESLGAVGAFTRRIWLSTDGRQLVAAGMIPYRSYAPLMCLWFVCFEPKPRSWFVSINTTFSGVDLTPDHRLCATTDEQTRDVVALFDLATGQCVARIPHERANISDLRFSRDTSRLAVVSESRVIFHSFSSRRWSPSEHSIDGFWLLEIDGDRRIAPVGTPGFVSAFERERGDAEAEWESAERAGRRAATGMRGNG